VPRDDVLVGRETATTRTLEKGHKGSLYTLVLSPFLIVVAALAFFFVHSDGVRVVACIIAASAAVSWILAKSRPFGKFGYIDSAEAVATLAPLCQAVGQLTHHSCAALPIPFFVEENYDTPMPSVDISERFSIGLHEGIPGVKCAGPVPTILTPSRDLSFTLDGVIIRKGGRYRYVFWRELRVDIKPVVVREELVATGAEIVGSTWEHPTKDNNPDRRFHENTEIMLARYFEIKFIATETLFCCLLIAESAVAHALFEALKERITAKPVSG